MKTKTFKTNINCHNCVRSVTGFIEEVQGIDQWKVDIENPDKILTVIGDVEPGAIVAAVEDAGFDIQEVDAK